LAQPDGSFKTLQTGGLRNAAKPHGAAHPYTTVTRTGTVSVAALRP